jgi:hypothetical protein
MIRFAVAGDTSRLHSATWRMWQTKKGDVYLLNRAAGADQKISLHHSRICRYAEITMGVPRKADIRWQRQETPVKGLSNALCMIFPTNYLATSEQFLPENILRIPPAPRGNATAIQVLFTRDNPQMVSDQLGTTAKLLSDVPMVSGEFCGIACFDFAEWQDEDVIVPASFHEERELRFTATVPEGVERTISLALHREPEKEGTPLVHIERYGYAVVPGAPCAPLTERHGTLSRSQVYRVRKA